MNQHDLAPAAPSNLSISEEYADTLKNAINCPDATEDDLRLYLSYCGGLGFDPLAGQAYLFKQGNRPVIGTSRDGYRTLANRTGEYMPSNRATEFATDDKGKIISATAFVLKFSRIDGRWHEVAATAIMDDWNRGSGPWKDKPAYMLEKQAEKMALRRAFPERLSGPDPEEDAPAAIDPPPHLTAPALAPGGAVDEDRLRSEITATLRNICPGNPADTTVISAKSDLLIRAWHAGDGKGNAPLSERGYFDLHHAQVEDHLATMLDYLQEIERKLGLIPQIDDEDLELHLESIE